MLMRDAGSPGFYLPAVLGSGVIVAWQGCLNATGRRPERAPAQESVSSDFFNVVIK